MNIPRKHCSQVDGQLCVPVDKNLDTEEKPEAERFRAIELASGRRFRDASRRVVANAKHVDMQQLLASGTSTLNPRTSPASQIVLVQKSPSAALKPVSARIDNWSEGAFIRGQM